MTAEKDYCKAGEVVSIPNLSGQWVRQSGDVRYLYDVDRSKCPVCGGLGMPWNGWFSCENEDCCVALVSTGEVFRPLIGSENK